MGFDAAFDGGLMQPPVNAPGIPEIRVDAVIAPADFPSFREGLLKKFPTTFST